MPLFMEVTSNHPYAIIFVLASEFKIQNMQKGKEFKILRYHRCVIDILIELAPEVCVRFTNQAASGMK